MFLNSYRVAQYFFNQIYPVPPTCGALGRILPSFLSFFYCLFALQWVMLCSVNNQLRRCYEGKEQKEKVCKDVCEKWPIFRICVRIRNFVLHRSLYPSNIISYL